MAIKRVMSLSLAGLVLASQLVAQYASATKTTAVSYASGTEIPEQSAAAKSASATGSMPADYALYVSNSNGNTITEYDVVTGELIRTVVKGGKELKGPKGIAFGPDGSLYVAGRYSNSVVRYDRETGALLQVLDSEHKGGIVGPQGINFGPDGKLYVASSDNDRIVRLNPKSGKFEATFATVSVSGVSHSFPIDPSFGRDGNLYVGTFNGHSVLKYQGPQVGGSTQNADAADQKTPKAGTLLTVFEQPNEGQVADASLAQPVAGHYLVDVINTMTYTGNVAEYSPDGKFVRTLIPTGRAGLGLPGGIAYGPDGSLYLANVKVDQTFQDKGSTIMKFDPATGKFLGVVVKTGMWLNVPFAMEFGPR